MSVSRSALQSAAASFLSSGGPIAWEAESAQRVAALVRSFQSGELDASGLRAALAGDRRAAPRPTPTKTTALLSLSGILTPDESLFTMLGVGTSVRHFTRELAAAAANRAVQSIVILCDSPGGSVRLLPEAATVMRSARMHKPIVVAVAGLAASAAYHIVSNATAIEATSSASIGAIGVITERVSVARQLEREGIDVHVFAAGKHKAEGHEATAISGPERQHIQARVDAAYTDFVNDVAAGRHVPASTVRAGFGEGRLVTAAEALRLGMIDRVAPVEETIGRAVSAPAELAAWHLQRAELARVALAPRRGEHARAELAERRRELIAAARGTVTR